MSVLSSCSNLGGDDIGTSNCVNNTTQNIRSKERLVPAKELWISFIQNWNTALKNDEDLGMWEFIQKLFHQCLQYISTILDPRDTKISKI